MKPPADQEREPQAQGPGNARLGWMSEGILRCLLPTHWREAFLGDLVEEWSTQIVPKFGATRARFWLWRQVCLSILAILQLRFRKVSIAYKMLFVTSLALGWLTAFVDSRPTWDDTGVLAFAILIACSVLGALGPKQPWLWAIVVGLWIPLHNIAVHHNYASLLALVFSLGGAYAGMAIRRMLLVAGT